MAGVFNWISSSFFMLLKIQKLLNISWVQEVGEQFQSLLIIFSLQVLINNESLQALQPFRKSPDVSETILQTLQLFESLQN